MKPILSIADLVKNPNFGANIIINESIDKVENAVILDYSLNARKATITIAREYPNRPDTEVKQHVWLKRNTSPANKAFFAKLEEAAYHVHGELQSDDFKEDFLPLYTAHLNDAFAYGDEPEVTKVTYGRDNVAHIQFTSQKKHITYDEVGEEIETIVSKKHNARWTLLDPSVDFNNTVVVPRTLFNTAPKFLRLVAEAIDVDINRIYLKSDPTDPGVQSVLVHFDPTDLIYAGSIPVTITPSGEAIHIYDNATGEEIEPEEGGEEPEQPVISDLEYDAGTQTLTGLVQNATEVSIKVDDGAPVTAPVVDGVLSHMFAEAPAEGATITVMAGTATQSITLPV